MSMFNLSVKFRLEIKLHLNICNRWFTNSISYKIYVYNVSAQRLLFDFVRACVCVCVCVSVCVCQRYFPECLSRKSYEEGNQ